LANKNLSGLYRASCKLRTPLSPRFKGAFVTLQHTISGSEGSLVGKGMPIFIQQQVLVEGSNIWQLFLR